MYLVKFVIVFFRCQDSVLSRINSLVFKEVSAVIILPPGPVVHVKKKKKILHFKK